MSPVLTTETKYRTAAEGAKGLKAELKKRWPKVKFSVVSKTYSMGDSISVSWNNGPLMKEVERITCKYEEGWFDGMTDSYNYEPTLIVDSADGKLKNLGGAKFVHTTRTIFGGYEAQAAFIENIERDICKLQRVEYVGPYTKIFDHGRGAVNDLVWPIISKIDFLKGNYAGLKFGEDGFEPVLASEVRS